jgi:ribose 5-phosphate isomerase B
VFTDYYGEVFMIWLASDHAGYELKKIIVDHLKEKNIPYEDMGSDDNKPTDYPPLARKVARAVSINKTDKGILICKSGQGMAMVANRTKNVRASVVWDKNVASETREDNDSNVLSLPAGYLSPDEAKVIVDTWLDTPASKAERHLRRIQQIDYI